jgi:hypothetical protein
MTFEEVGKKHYKIEQTADGTIISIPSRKNWFIILFIGFWLIGWAVGEVSVIGILSAGVIKALNNGIPEISKNGPGAFGGLFLFAWLGGWTVGGAFAIYAWLWQVKGIERISISTNALIVEKLVPIWKRKKEYHLKDVVALRLSHSSPSMFTMSGSMEFWGMPGGRLAFDYGAKTVQFGSGIDEAEAKFLIEDIENRCPKIVEKLN